MDERELNIKDKEIDLSLIESALTPNMSSDDASDFQLMPDKVY